MMRMSTATVLAAVLLAGTTARSADLPALTIKDHQFSPEVLEVPAGERVKLSVTNADATAEEFDSSDLHVEKMIPAGQTAFVFIGPLSPGSYAFVGELHEDTARGKITAK